MAVPPIERSQAMGLPGPATGARFAWLLDVILGLLIVAALPLAILSIPNTVSLVSGLLPPEFDKLDLIRAHGLALPAMMLTVPLASVLVQRMKAAPILLTGLAVLAVADAAGGFAGSAFLVGALRVVHGVGAGLLVPALLMAAWERAPLLRALWTGMLAVSLLAAQALALWPLDDVRDWRITLQPYPLLTGIALGLAAIYLAVGVATGAPSTPGPRAVERTRLTLTAVPAAGLAVLAVGTTFGWPPALVILAALFSVAALLTLASIGTFEGPAGRSLAYAMLAVGVVVLPTAAQVTYMELGGVGGPGLNGLWLPFLVCALMGAGAALAVGMLDMASMQRLSRAGLVTIVLGLCTVRLMVPAGDGFMLVVPFALLAVGAAVALTAALRMSGPGAALYGLTLCFPGVLAGYLLGTGIQMVLLGRPQSAQQLVDRFVEALHLWALIGGFLVVAVIVLAALLGRRSAARASETESEIPCGVPGDVEGTAPAAEAVPATTAEQAGLGAVDGHRREWPDEFPVAGDGIAPEEPDGTTARPNPTAQDEDAPTGEVPRMPSSRAKPARREVAGDRASADGASSGRSRPGSASSSEGVTPRRVHGEDGSPHAAGSSTGEASNRPPHGAGSSRGDASPSAGSSTGEALNRPPHGAGTSKGDASPSARSSTRDASDRRPYGTGSSKGEAADKPSYGSTGSSEGGAVDKPSYGAGSSEGGVPDGTRYGTALSGTDVPERTPNGGTSRTSERKDAADGEPSPDGAASDGAVSEGPATGNGQAERPGEGTGPVPVVPPPTQSPEDSDAD
ncbi:hypothetical protein ACFSKW_48865 [Nonomuraea mangrovi]|uniref:MFS transporter n=1 Tax=Nonomuraea mangrovi TaxID=2316207 RepID=A0ABW4TEN1_9ACTN